ncbi:MAG: sporulation peptidase YabG [Bacilli bacterium]|nr:sporulation peptidase YabG [Bacilli bacterium]
MGDVVGRKSYHCDIPFKIISINNNIACLKGLDVRLYADAVLDDLEVLDSPHESDQSIIDENIRDFKVDRDNYFYLPGKILHIDGDKDYLDRCMNFYKKLGIKANGLTIPEDKIYSQIGKLLEDYHPDIVVITGHDAYHSKKNNLQDLNNYENSKYFASAIKEARKYEHNQDKLIIIAGACQSNYESLIKAGANFASSPKRINIHALDPAIVASSLSFSDRNQSIDLMKIIDKTKYGSEGIGGLITNGTMYVGYPR